MRDSLGFNRSALVNLITDGTVYAVLCRDMKKARDANICVSPAMYSMMIVNGLLETLITVLLSQT